MKLLKVCLAIFVLSLCIACSSEFDKSMNAAKESMKQEDYETAIEHLNIATIESPTDKAATALLERAKKSLEDQKMKETYSKYVSGVKDIKDYIENNIIPINTSEISVIEADKLLPTAKEYLTKAEALYDELNLIDTEYAYSIEYLVYTSQLSVKLLEQIIENVDDPLPSFSPDASWPDRRRAELKSNDSRIRAESSKKYLLTNFESFKNSYAELIRIKS